MTGADFITSCEMRKGVKNSAMVLQTDTAGDGAEPGVAVNGVDVEVPVSSNEPALQARVVPGAGRMIMTLSGRALTMWSPMGMFFASLMYVGGGLAMGSVYGSDLNYTRYQSDAAMAGILLGVIVGASALDVFKPAELLVYRREMRSYSPWVYWLARNIQDLPNILSGPFFYVLIWAICVHSDVAFLTNYVIALAFAYHISGFVHWISIALPRTSAILIAML